MYQMDRNETIIYYYYLNEYLLEYDLLPLLEKHKPAAKTGQNMSVYTNAE